MIKVDVKFEKVYVGKPEGADGPRVVYTEGRTYTVPKSFVKELEDAGVIKQKSKCTKEGKNEE